MATPSDADLHDSCLRCGRLLRLGADPCYLVKVEAMADPSPPIIDDPESSSGKVGRMIDSLSDLSPQEAMDQVYRRLSFYLCGSCYRLWIENPAG